MSWTFREVTCARDLEAVFRLRYRAFECSAARALVADRIDGVDVEPCDRTARHYAVFDDIGSPLAAVRAVGWETSPHVSAIDGLLDRFGGAGTKPAVPLPFPLLTHVDLRDVPSALRSSLESPGLVIEFGRVCRDPDMQVGGPRAFQMLAEGTLAAEFLLRGLRCAVGMSVAGLVVMYRQLGFVPVDDREVTLRGTTTLGKLLALDRESLLAHPLRARLESLAEELREHGAVLRPSIARVAA